MNTKIGIDDNLINQIRSSIDIVDIISNYIPLKKKGKNYFGVCPFHSDHSPSMSVSSERQIFKCFSCGAAGNVFKFLMDYENISFSEAIKILADKAGIDVALKSNIKEKPIKYQNLYELYELSQMFYQNNINTKEGKEAKEYLAKRNLNSEVIKEFGIGLALSDYTMLTKLLIKKGKNPDELIKSGLVNKNIHGYNDIYFNRIMFPLWDINGRIVGYSGRIYRTSDISKYINTKETDIFKKGEMLYNYHRAKDETRKVGKVIVVEGFMDVIRCYSVGITNVIATMGTAVTKFQASLIKRMAKEVILCFDGDQAGAKATESCINELNKIGVIPKVVRLEENLDPDEYILKYGKEQFINKLDNAINVMDFKLNYLKSTHNFSDNTDIAKYIGEMLKEISQIEDEILKELTLQKLSQENKIDISILKNKLDELVVQKKNIETKIIKPDSKKKITKFIKAEQALLYYMLDHKDVVKICNENLFYMPTNKYRMLFREINYFYKQHKDVNIADIMTMVSDNEEMTGVINELLTLNLKDEYTKSEIIDYINTIKEYNVRSEFNRLKNELLREIDPIKKANIAQKMIDVKKINDIKDGDRNDKRN